MGGGGDPDPLHSEIFSQVAPYYLSIGMSPSDFWDGDPEYAVHYREADKLRKSRASYDAWLQGYYIYETLINVAPLYRFGIKNPKVRPYFEKPIPVTAEGIEMEETEKEQRIMNKGLQKMFSLTVKVNQRYADATDSGT